MDCESVTAVKDFTLCYSEAVIRQTAADRFILRVYALLDERQIAQKTLRGTKSEGWISSKLRGSRNLKLNEAEEIAASLETPLAELLRRPQDRLYELDNREQLVIEGFRQLSKEEQAAFLTIITLRQRAAPYASGRKLASRTRGPLPTGAADGRLATDRAAAAAAGLALEFDARAAEYAPGTRGQAPATRPHQPVVSHPDRKLRGPGAKAR